MYFTFVSIILAVTLVLSIAGTPEKRVGGVVGNVGNMLVCEWYMMCVEFVDYVGRLAMRFSK